MVVQLVTGRNHRAGRFGVDPHLVAEGEEAGTSVMTYEHDENFRGVLRIGSVIDGQPDFTLAGAQMPEDGSIRRSVRGEGRAA